MAVVQYGSMVTELKGKLNSHVFQSTAAGYIIRSTRRHSKSPSPAVRKQQQAMAAAASVWKNLSSSQIQAWQAQGVNALVKDKFGNTRTPTGFQTFMAVNGRLNSSGAMFFFQPGAPDPFYNVPVVTINELITSPHVKIQTTTVVNAGQVLCTFCSRSVSPGCKNPPGGYQLISSLNAPSAGIYDITTAYVAAFGAPIALAKVFFKFVLYSVISGAASPLGTLLVLWLKLSAPANIPFRYDGLPLSPAALSAAKNISLPHGYR